MVSPNRITHDNPELRDVLLEFLDSASSLCDMTDTTMAAVPDEIMSIQADEACGAEYGARSDRRADSRNGYRSRRLDTTVGTLDLRIPKPGSGSYFPTDLPGRYSRTDRALASFAPDASRVLEDAEVDALAYLSFPREHRIKIRTNNVRERMNCEPRRRTKVVQTFPSTGSVLRLLGGIAGEADAGWASENLFMSKESLRPVLGLERAENRIEGFAPSEEVRKRAEVIMMVALDEYAKAS